MPEVSDVDLMELADGTLIEPRRSLVEAELARNPELQARLEIFRVTGSALARVFDPVMGAPVPPRLLEALGGRGTTQTQHVLHLTAAPVGSNRRLKFADVTRLWPFSSGVVGGGLAWAAVAVAVLGLGALSWSVRSNHADNIATSLSTALERTPSRQTAAVVLEGRGSGTLEPDLSFRHVDGNYCRQYEVRFDAGGGLAGYACRVAEGRWQVEKEADFTSASPKPPRHGEIRPSGRRDPSTKTIDDAVDKVAIGDALQPSQELELISRGWTSNDRQ